MRAGDFDLQADGSSPDDYVSEDEQEARLVDDLRSSIRDEDWDTATTLLDQFSVNIPDNYEIMLTPIEKTVRALRAQLEILTAAKFTTLYSQPSTTILLPEVFVEVERRLAEAIAAKPSILDSIDPRAFEELMASIYARLGFHVFLTARTRDGGRDVVAIGEKGGSLLKYIVECKRYRRDRKVGIAQVQRLWGVKVSEGATKAVLATTSSFSMPAQEFAQKHIWELELADYLQVLRMLRIYLRH